MDASQFTLALSARSQIASKVALRAEKETLGSDKAFASVLTQKLDRDEERRKAEAERQNERQTAHATLPARQPSEPRATLLPRYSEVATTTEHDTPNDDQGTPKSEVADKSEPHPKATSPVKQPAAPQKTDATASTDTTQADDNSSAKAAKTGAKDDTQQADEQQKTTVGQALSALQEEQATTQPTEGQTTADASQQKKTSQKGAGSKQSSDQDSDKKDQDGASGASPVIIVPLPILVVSTPPKSSGNDTATIDDILNGTPKTGATGGVDPTTINPGAGNSTGNGNGNATKKQTTTPGNVVGIPGLPLPGIDTSGSADPKGVGAIGVGATQGNPLPTPANPSLNDPDTDFASIVAGKTDLGLGGRDNFRVTVVKPTQSSITLPRPSVRRDDAHLPEPAIQASPTLSQSESKAPSYQAAEETTQIEPAAGPSYANISSGYLPPSYLQPGAGPLGGGAKATDFLATIRQQLATASVQDQVAVHMQRAIKDSVDKISIQLSPGELGHIHVKMNVDEDKQVSATITVEKPATLELLQKDTKALERALQEAGLKTDSGSLSFSLQRGNQGDSSDTPGWGQAGRQTGSSRQEKTAAAPEVASGGRGNEVDTANGLVNVAV